MTASQQPISPLSGRMRAQLWARSVVLPDLTRAAPLKRVLAWYTPARASADWAGLSAADVLGHIERHLAGCRRMRGRRCLRRGLLAFYFLRLARHAPVLHLGVFARPQGRTLAHCWTTVGGIVDDPPQAPCVEVLRWGEVASREFRVASRKGQLVTRNS